MNTTTSDPTTDHMVFNHLDNDLDPECEKTFDSEKYEQLSESEQFDFRSEAEKGGCLDCLPGLQSEEYKSESEKENYKPEPEKDDCKSESDKVDFKTESEDSDLESERSQNGSEVYDRLNDIQITGCGDGIIESNMPGYDESPKNNVAIRRCRGLQDSDSGLKELANDLCQFELWQTKSEDTDFKKTDLPCDIVAGTKMAKDNTSTIPVSSFKTWFKYIAPKTMCLIILSLVYFGFTIFGIKVLNFSPNST